MSILRVHYQERQRLSAADLRLEQGSRLARAGRHELGNHHWGVVCGLRVVADRDEAYWLTSGVAVDVYGREIVVPAPLALDLAGLKRTGRWYVLLWYCEQAVPAGAGQAPQRIASRPAVLVSAVAPIKGAAVDIELARAAGVDTLAPSPVMVATIDPALPSPSRIGYALTPYASGRAATLRAPHGRAEMRLGQQARSDFYRFMLSTRDETAGLTRRIGIDRDHGLHIWRTLHISAKTGLAMLTVRGKVQLRLTAPLPAGPGGRMSVSGKIIGKLDALEITLEVVGSGQASTANASAPKGKSVPLSYQDGRSARARLWNSHDDRALTFGDGRAMLAKAYEGSSFSATLDPLDARLVMKNVLPVQSETRAPGDIRRSRGASPMPGASALVLRPAATDDAAGAGAGLAMYAVAATPTTTRPATVLRIAGGTGDATDAATRVSIGVRLGSEHRSALSMDAGGNLTLQAMPEVDGGAVLKVRGSVYLPPIGARDPLLPELLMLAYLGGLCRIGKVTSGVAIELEAVVPENPPASPPTSPTYRIKVVTEAGVRAERMRMMELITDVGGHGELSFRTLSAPAGETPIIERLPALPGTRARQVTVLMLVQMGADKRVTVSNALPLQAAIHQP
jgi:hypothetical protein